MNIHRSLNPAIALLALLLAPLGSALVIVFVFVVSRWSQGSHFSVYLADAAPGVLVGAALLLIGGPLIVAFWKRAPFRLTPCLIVGAVCGAAAFWLLGLGLSDVDDRAWFESEGKLLEYYLGAAQLVLVGGLAGAGGALLFWGICRAGSKEIE